MLGDSTKYAGQFDEKNQMHGQGLLSLCYKYNKDIQKDLVGEFRNNSCI